MGARMRCLNPDNRNAARPQQCHGNDRRNERNEDTEYVGEVYDGITNEIVELIRALGVEQGSFADLGIDLEEKAIYDILKALTIKYDFTYPEEKLVELAKVVKQIVDVKAKYTDWSQRDDIKAELKVELILVLAKHGYPPVDRDEIGESILCRVNPSNDGQK